MIIGIVLVTYNRLNKLKKTLQCYDEQIYKPSYILVVNNNSTDGTKDYLEEWLKTESNYSKYVFNEEFNSGGSGGFYKGQIEAVKLDADWIYLSDDDAYPNRDALLQIKNTFDNINDYEKTNIVSICSAVYHDGKIDKGHRVRIKKTPYMIKFPGVDVEEYKKEYFEIDILSYVGSAIRKDVFEKAGFVDKDLFIYFDDQDHSLRVRKYGKIICVPNSIIIHDTIPKKYKEINWGRFYSTRNKLYLIKNNFNIYYYIVWFLLGYIRDCIFEKNKTLRSLNKEAYRDVKNNKKGIHQIYKPGWKL